MGGVSTHFIDINCHWKPFFFAFRTGPEVASSIIGMGVHNDNHMVPNPATGNLTKRGVVISEPGTLFVADLPAGPPSQHVLHAHHHH